MPIALLILMLEALVQMHQVLRGAAAPGDVFEYTYLILGTLVVTSNAPDDLDSVVAAL